jgi:hypothetical protein
LLNFKTGALNHSATLPWHDPLLLCGNPDSVWLARRFVLASTFSIGANMFTLNAPTRIILIVMRDERRLRALEIDQGQKETTVGAGSLLSIK